MKYTIYKGNGEVYEQLPEQRGISFEDAVVSAKETIKEVQRMMYDDNAYIVVESCKQKETIKLDHADENIENYSSASC